MKTKNYVSVLEERNIQICKEVVEESHQNHTYYGEGIFVYGDMALAIYDATSCRILNYYNPILDASGFILKRH